MFLKYIVIDNPLCHPWNSAEIGQGGNHSSAWFQETLEPIQRSCGISEVLNHTERDNSIKLPLHFQRRCEEITTHHVDLAIINAAHLPCRLTTGFRVIDARNLETELRGKIWEKLGSTAAKLQQIRTRGYARKSLHKERVPLALCEMFQTDSMP